MRQTKFKKVILIGYGKITGEILQHVYDKSRDYGYEIECIEHEIHPFNAVKRICKEYEIFFSSVYDKQELTKKLTRIEEDTLILSVSNNFLFPAEVVEKNNLTIVNFHNALLPKFPGRNAPSWAIYEGEYETGVTWHYVTTGVDEGNIIIQKKCEIGLDTKAYELTEKLMNLAYEAFCECFQGILEDSVTAIAQEFIPNRKMYNSKEVPGNGHFTMQDAPSDIYRLLRSVDYGKNAIFPVITATYNGQEVKIVRYKKIEKEKLIQEEGCLYLSLDETHMLRIKYSE